MIGLAKQYGELYVLHAQPNFCTSFPTSSYHTNSSLDNNSKLWHLRLGHIYNFIHKCVYVQFHFITFNKTIPCDTFHFSKQKRLLYPISTTSFKKIDHVHVDI